MRKYKILLDFSNKIIILIVEVKLKGETIMKKLLILFSILFAFICCKNSVSAPKSEGSQIIGGGSVRKNTNLPTWNISYTTIPQEYWGKYHDLNDYYMYYMATVTYKDITLYYKDYDGNTREGGYFLVFDKNAEYLGDNTWHWNYYYDDDIYRDKDKYDFRTSLIPPDIKRFERNEKGQRILIMDRDNSSYIHEDDINK